MRSASALAAEPRRLALDHLLRLYLPALRAHLVRKRRLGADEADDLLQGFVAERVVQRNLTARASQHRGRFRTFLLTALDNYVAGVREYENARKRCQPCLQVLIDSADAAMVQEDPHAADVFDLAWARQVLSEAQARMREQCRQDGRTDLWEVFDCRIRAPLLDQAAPTPYEVLVKRFGLESPAQAANLLVTAKRSFRRILRQVIGEYVQNDEQVDQEIRDLAAILARDRAEL